MSNRPLQERSFQVHRTYYFLKVKRVFLTGNSYESGHLPFTSNGVYGKAFLLKTVYGIMEELKHSIQAAPLRYVLGYSTDAEPILRSRLFKILPIDAFGDQGLSSYPLSNSR